MNGSVLPLMAVLAACGGVVERGRTAGAKPTVQLHVCVSPYEAATRVVVDDSRGLSAKVACQYGMAVSPGWTWVRVQGSGYFSTERRVMLHGDRQWLTVALVPNPS